MAEKVLGGREQVRAAVVQASPVFMNKKGCLEKACDLILEAGKEGAEIIVFLAQSLLACDENTFSDIGFHSNPF